MGRIVAFPAPKRAKRAPVENVRPVPEMNLPRAIAAPAALSRVFAIAWIFFLLMWPLLQWLVAFDIVYQFLRALYYWNSSGVYAGFTFLIHLSAGSTLTYLVATRRIE